MPKVAKAKFATREEWLMAAMKYVRPLFLETVNVKVPEKVRISCGFPSKNPLGNKKRRIGECWSDKASAGKVFEIFVSPVLNNPAEVLDTLVHEVVHATVGLEAGHKAPFVRMAKSVGLTEGKPTQAAAGPELLQRINGWAKELGDYPHDRLDKMVTLKKAPDKCRLLKAACECGCIIRITRKCMDSPGLPTCACGGEFVCDDYDGDGGDDE
jgi:hypothetical protein